MANEVDQTLAHFAPAPRWQRLEDLFHHSATLHGPQREAYLHLQCSGDPDLLEQVLALLRSDSSVSDLMSTPMLAPEADYLVRPAEDDLWCGRTLGDFQLQTLLGRGGMGAVYLGTRVGKGLLQRVAVKLMARHLQSTPARNHFLLERDALATLSHRNVASLVDGGLTADGIPYLVMEYIEGPRLDAVADDRQTTLRHIASLMIQLCEAVSYVHRNLILHRDLKPGNVMVTGEGVVKLLDFGTLKSIAARTAADSLMTQAGMRPMTLAYASPEHIRASLATPGTVAPVPSTALDIYSLGMTLYRLLAGRLPAAMDTSSLPAHLAVLQLDAFPPPTATMAPSRRQQDPRLAADLDAIALKAIRFAQSGRYDSADALAADLTRALADQPVLARAGTVQYRAGRFLRRHRTTLAGTLAASLVLAAGLPIMAHQRAVAREQSRRALAGVQQERILSHLLLFTYFDELKRIPGSTDAQHRAVTKALQYLDSLSQTSPDDALQLDSIQAYIELGVLQGSQYEENFGDVSGGILTLTKAVDSAQRLVAQNPANVTYLATSASAEHALGQLYFTARNTQQALTHYTRSAESSQRLATMPGVTSAMLIPAASSVDGLGDTLGLPGFGTLDDPIKALDRYKQARLIYVEALKLDPACVLCTRGVVIEDYKIGLDTVDKAEAAGFYQNGLNMLATLSPAEQMTTRSLRALNLISQNLGSLEVNSGHTAEGLTRMLAVQQRLRAAVQADPIDSRAKGDLALFEDWLGSSYVLLGQYALAKEHQAEFVTLADTLAREDSAHPIWHFRHGLALSRYGQSELHLGEQKQAGRSGRESLSILVPLAMKPDADARVLSITADALVAFHPDPPHDGPLAVSLIQRAIARKQRPEAEDYLLLADSLRLAGARDQAADAASHLLKLLAPHDHSLTTEDQRTRATAILNAASSH